MYLLFWILAALLTVTAIAALAPALLRPRNSPDASRRDANLAIYRQRMRELDDQRETGTLTAEDFHALRSELEAQAAEDLRAAAEDAGATARRRPRRGHRAALMVLLTLPVAAVLLYHFNGGNRPWHDILTLSYLPVDADDLQRVSAVRELAEVLEREVAVNPDNARAWAMLGQAYVALERYPEGRDAFARRVRLGQPDAADLVEYAEARALAEGGRFDDEARRLLRAALARNPEEPRGLWLAGFAALQAGEGDEALRHWNQLEGLLPEGNPLRESLAPYLHAAREQAGGGEAEADPTEPADGDGPSLSVEVSLDSTLLETVSAEDTLFVFARAADGPAMPVAASRLPASSFPVTVTLGANDSPMPGRTLADVRDVVVEARISRNGTVEMESGDLYGRSDPVALDQNDRGESQQTAVRVRIDSVRH